MKRKNYYIIVYLSFIYISVSIARCSGLRLFRFWKFDRFISQCLKCSNKTKRTIILYITKSEHGWYAEILFSKLSYVYYAVSLPSKKLEKKKQTCNIVSVTLFLFFFFYVFSSMLVWINIFHEENTIFVKCRQSNTHFSYKEKK